MSLCWQPRLPLASLELLLRPRAVLDERACQGPSLVEKQAGGCTKAPMYASRRAFRGTCWAAGCCATSTDESKRQTAVSSASMEGARIFVVQNTGFLAVDVDAMHVSETACQRVSCGVRQRKRSCRSRVGCGNGREAGGGERRKGLMLAEARAMAPPPEDGGIPRGRGRCVRDAKGLGPIAAYFTRQPDRRAIGRGHSHLAALPRSWRLGWEDASSVLPRQRDLKDGKENGMETWTRYLLPKSVRRLALSMARTERVSLWRQLGYLQDT